MLKAAEESINVVVDDVSKLSQAASKLPYYKFNNMWSRQMQNAVSRICLYLLYITDIIIGRGPSLLGLAGRLQVRWRRDQGREAAHHRRAGRDPEEYVVTSISYILN